MKACWISNHHWWHSIRAGLAFLMGFFLATSAFAQATATSPWENAVGVLQQAFTSTIARGLSLVAIGVEDLIEAGTLERGLDNQLEGYILARKNILIVGATSSGKTSMLNVLGKFIPSDERVLLISIAGGWQSGSYPETGCEEFVPPSDILESWIVLSILAPRAFAPVLKRMNLRSLIEFVLQLPLESHKV